MFRAVAVKAARYGFMSLTLVCPQRIQRVGEQRNGGVLAGCSWIGEAFDCGAGGAGDTLKQTEQHTGKQRQAGRIALDRHLLLNGCVHFESCRWCFLTLFEERVVALLHGESGKTRK